MPDREPLQRFLDTDCCLLLVDGTRLAGRLRALGADWWSVDTDNGAVVVNPRQVAAVAEGQSLATPRAPRRERRARGGSPGRPWADDELRRLADAFLDGETDKELARDFDRTPAVIKQLRQGFEIARGNLTDDAVGAIARSWVGRWQDVLTR